MQFDHQSASTYLRESEFEELFTQVLGWDNHSQTLPVIVDETKYVLTALAEKRGMTVYECPQMTEEQPFPDYATRRKIQRQVAKASHENFIIYTNAEKTMQIWQWVKRRQGKPDACREHRYETWQSGDSLIQKLQNIAFSLDEEEEIGLFGVIERVGTAFYAERVTKKFYDRFKKEHDAFLEFLSGIPDEEMQKWYVSVMLNRLMFIYFIQKKNFLNKNDKYLQTKLTDTKRNGTDLYYKEFLCPLFFEGFAKPEDERTPDIRRLLGKIPYLNGGIFQKHEIETLHGQNIEIPDTAFEKLFAFFEQYDWHLDDRPLKNDKEINPDVLGYIFEKYINQKQMGAYYTKEDITEYISKNTIIPFLFDAAKKSCKIAFEGDTSVWKLLQKDPDRYIYDAIKKGVELPLPAEIAIGIDNVSERTKWNERAPDGVDEIALPTEIWREVVARRQRHDTVRSKLANGEIDNINDLITYNLNIGQFAQDVIESCEGPELLRAFWKAITQVTVLDPTCGSGAFLFAALNILEPLYEACLDRMQVFLDEVGAISESRPNQVGAISESRPSRKYKDFSEILDRIAQHPNREYFVLKSIIINNLYGVDIMEEAIEICKLRLFLKMVAQIEDVKQIEPLPDIDFNIQAGNTLVGFATYNEIEESISGRLDFDNTMERIKEKAEDVEQLFVEFRRQQTTLGGDVKPADKLNLQSRLQVLEDELNEYLAGVYDVDLNKQPAYEKWLNSYKPFHWFIAFYGILQEGGFDVIIGNPPYVEYKEVKSEYKVIGYQTMICGNLYAMVWELVLKLTTSGHIGFIVPAASVCTDGYASLRKMLIATGELVISSYGDNPGNLFKGLPHSRLSIILLNVGVKIRRIFSTKYNKWRPQERDILFENLTFVESTEIETQFSISKLGNNIEKSILGKYHRTPLVLSQQPMVTRHSPVYYTRKLSHFVQILNFIPLIYDQSGNRRNPSELKEIWFADEETANAIMGFLNSSLFSWIITIHSDCRNLNKREINMTRFNLTTEHHLTQLATLAVDLMIDIESNSCMLQQRDLTIQATYPRKSKSIIDKIDRVLAEHYGFTDEELDFIINYDIKYRMGLGN